MKERRWFLLLCILCAALLAAPAMAEEGTLTLPADLREIGEESFAGLSSASVVIVPEGVESISPRSFAGSGLSEVRLPATLKRIGDGAFRDCGTNDTKRWYFMPEGIAVGEDAFTGCSARIYLDGVEPPCLTYTMGEDGVTITGLSGDMTEVTIPETIGGLSVTAIGNGAFRNKSGLTAVALPTGLTSIGSQAFDGCRVLEDVTLPAGLKTIGESAFNDTYALMEINFPAGLESIGTKAFRYSGITEAILPDGVALGTEIFSRCGSLVKVQLPRSLTEIPDYTFYNCQQLAEVGFPESLTAIGRDAFNNTFYRQAGSTVFELPDTLQTLGSGAFNGCGAGLCVTRGGTVETLMRDNGYTFTRYGETDFRYKYNSATVDGETVYTLYLTAYVGQGGEVTIPQGPVVIGEGAFKQNAAVTAVSIPEGVTTINRSAFEQCTALARASLPETLTNIQNWAFGNCAQLTDINFPQSLTVIKSDAFRGTCTAEGIHYYELPDGLTECDSYVFPNCGAVLSVVRNSDTEALIRQSQNYIFAYRDAPDLRYKMGYYGSDLQLGLYDYLGNESPLHLPNDCKAVRYDGFKDLVDGGLICDQLSSTAAALSRAQLNFTFPGHKDFRYRVIDDILYVMGYAGDEAVCDIPAATDYVIAGVDVQIRAGAFKDQTQFTTLVIPDGVSRINADAFSGCVNMTDITLPNSLKSIDTKAFLNVGQNAAEPFYLVLPDTLEDIVGRGGGANTFEDFYGVLVCGKTSATAALLTDRNYVYTAPDEYDYRYRYESYTEGEETGRRLWLVGYEGEGATADIPAGIYGIKRYSSNTTYANWRTFHGNGFYGRESLTKAVIPEGTKVIEDSAFLGCVNLTDVTFPDSLRVLKNHAFEMCGSASAGNYYYFLPDNVEEIAGIGGAGWESFNGITGTLVCGQDTVTAYELSRGNYDFAIKGHHDDGLLYRYENRELNGETKQRLYVYNYVGSAKEVSIPGDIGVYGVSRTPPGGSDSWKPAFYGNKTLKKVVIPEGVAIVEDSAFSGCTLLSDITLPESLRVLKNHAFEYTGTSAGVRFIVVLPAGLEEMTTGNGAGWASFNSSAATLVVQNKAIADAMYEDWWQYYGSVADAEAGINLIRQPNDQEGFTWNGHP